MKYFNSVLFKSVCFLSLIFIIQACDNEFSEIGTGIVGTPDFEIKNSTYPITTYNKKITAFESNNLSKNLLGYYYDPVFGGTKVDFVGRTEIENDLICRLTVGSCRYDRSTECASYSTNGDSKSCGERSSVCSRRD